MVFVTGHAANKTDGDDYATIAYNAATGAQLWVRLYNAVGNVSFAGNVAAAVTVSPTGKAVFVTGYTFRPNSNPAYATVAYNAATGAQLWVKSYRLRGRSNEAYSVAVSPTGNTVFVTGTSGGATLAAAEYATIAYNAATGAQRWVKLYKSRNGADASQVAVSPAGKTVFVTGSNGGDSYGTVAYDAVTGAQRWAKLYQVPYGGAARQVAVSPTGKTVFVTGYSDDASGGSDYATVAYNAATGAQRWAKHYKGKLANQATSVAVSPAGTKVYVTGTSYGKATGGGTYGYATVAYNAATGAQLWVARRDAGSISLLGAFAVAVSPTRGTVFVTGQGQGNSFAGDYVTVAYRG
jgi:outer membrane protein assembly factor BamB